MITCHISFTWEHKGTSPFSFLSGFWYYVLRGAFRLSFGFSFWKFWGHRIWDDFVLGQHVKVVFSQRPIWQDGI